MFAFQIPNQNDLFQFWPGTRFHSNYMEKIIPLAEKNRQLALNRGEKRERRTGHTKTSTEFPNNLNLNK